MPRLKTDGAINSAILYRWMRTAQPATDFRSATHLGNTAFGHSISSPARKAVPGSNFHEIIFVAVWFANRFKCSCSFGLGEFFVGLCFARVRYYNKRRSTNLDIYIDYFMVGERVRFLFTSYEE